MRNKKFRVNIDQNTSFDYYVSAKNVSEAKKKAFAKQAAKKPSKKHYSISVDKL